MPRSLVSNIAGLVMHALAAGRPSGLVVEGWIAREGKHPAVAEFEQHGYQYIVPTGGLTTRRGLGGRCYAEGAGCELIRWSIPKDRIIVAPARKTESQRTYESTDRNSGTKATAL